MTFRMIQPMGNMPVTTPKSAARMASPAGMVNRKMETAIAARRAMTAAICAFTLPDAIIARSRTTGMAAATVDKVALPKGL